MAKLDTLFETFLSNVNPSPKMVEYAHSAHDPVRKFLESDEGLGKFIEGSFLYGSYKRRTAVGNIKDVDVVLLTTFDPYSQENTPQRVLRKLKSILTKYYKDADNQDYQRRSIRVNQPLP